MSIIKRNREFFPEMNGLFDDLFTRNFWDWGLSNNSVTNTSIPAVNIKETADAFEVEMAAPGMKKEDFRIELDNNQLIITSEKENREEQKDGERYSRREFSYQSFRRTFQLPKEVVDSENIQAHYENGLLNLVIPKKEEVKQRPPKMIEIR
jgi:HSP20 family protein